MEREVIHMYQCYQYKNTNFFSWLIHDAQTFCWKYSEDDKNLLKKLNQIDSKLDENKVRIKNLVFLSNTKAEEQDLKKKLGLKSSEILQILR